MSEKPELTEEQLRFILLVRLGYEIQWQSDPTEPWIRSIFNGSKFDAERLRKYARNPKYRIKP